MKHHFKSANIHLTGLCNYSCVFCHSGKGCSSGRDIAAEKWRPIIEDLICQREITKINFVGGEPLLYPELKTCIRVAKDCGATTSIVSNGSLITDKFLHETSGYLDWIGLSIDSTQETNELLLGRHCKGINHLHNVQKVATVARACGFKTKVNVTVTKYCLNECFEEFIRDMNPNRVKFFQVSPVTSVNDVGYESLKVTEEEFELFRSRNSNIEFDNGIHPVFETDKDQYNSYLMIDSSGNIRFNSDSGYKYVKYEQFWDEGIDRYLDINKYVKRGGIYSWNDNTKP